jgi:hypothetical protein
VSCLVPREIATKDTDTNIFHSTSVITKERARSGIAWYSCHCGSILRARITTRPEGYRVLYGTGRICKWDAKDVQLNSTNYIQLLFDDQTAYREFRGWIRGFHTSPSPSASTTQKSAARFVTHHLIPSLQGFADQLLGKLSHAPSATTLPIDYTI